VPKTITASVGRSGKNLGPDTLTVQQLLNGVSEFEGGPKPKLEEDSKCGKLTIGAIQKFQLHHFGWSGADGLVDPDGPTLRKLNALNPDPVAPPPPPLPPNPEPLSTDFIIWLRFKGTFFTEPLDPNEFVFTVVDVTNNRDAAYVFSFGTKRPDIPPFPVTGSGGHMKRFKARKPTTVSGFGGPATYVTRVSEGTGKATDRLSSRFSMFPEAWREGSGIGGVTVEFGAHLFKPRPDEFGFAQMLTGTFELM
jgi:hypothetical protein